MCLEELSLNTVYEISYVSLTARLAADVIPFSISLLQLP